MIKTIFKISIRFILYKTEGILGFVRKSFLLAVISLTISIFSLIVLDSIKNGYKEKLNLKLSNLESHIETISDNISRKTVLDIIDIIESTVFKVALFTELKNYQVLLKEEGIIRAGRKAEGVNVVSIDESFKDSKNIYKEFYDFDDSLLNFENEVILGVSLKEKLDVDIDDTIHLFKATDFIHNSFNKTTKPLRVKGFFKTGHPSEDAYTAIIDNKTFLDFYNNAKIKSIKIYLRNIGRQEEIRDLIYAKAGIPLYISTFNEKFSTISASLDQIFDIISIIIFFFILLAILNIISSIRLIIESKTEQIKVLKLSGINPLYISLIFIFISLISIISAFFIAYILAEIIILIQNQYQIISISPDVYIISKLIGIIDYNYILLFLFSLIIAGVLLSAIPSYKTIYKRGNI